MHCDTDVHLVNQKESAGINTTFIVVLLCNRQHMHVALNMDVATKSI
jgi:hypothetical protein